MNFVLSMLAGNLVKILMKMLMNAVGEQQLARILFTALNYFAAKTPSTKDDAMVRWAKDLYLNQVELAVEVADYTQASNSEPLKAE